MQPHIHLVTAPAVFTAVIRASVPRSELSAFIPAACGEVWSFLRDRKIQGGRHIALYLEGGVVEVGAEVYERFTGSERVFCSGLPSGQAVSVTHFGPYDELARAHAELRCWSARHGHVLAEVCWEVYGHWEESWNADASKIRTDIFHLLQVRKG
jgi:effector-binding domain-containing protein